MHERLTRCRRDVLAVSVVLLGALAAFSACGPAGDGNGAAGARETRTTATSEANQVEMRLIAFRPVALKAQPGSTVTWKQEDSGFHTVTSGTVSADATGTATTSPDGTFGSERLAKGESFSFKFERPGTYRYFCEIHPATMQATVTVA